MSKAKNGADHANSEGEYIPPNAPDMSILEENSHSIERPVFPLSVFPDKIKEWIETEAAIKCAPVDYVAACMLGAGAALVGTTRQVQGWEGFNQYALLWLVIIGNPSSNKSPSMSGIESQLKRLERGYSKAHKAALLKLEKKIIEAKKAKKEWEIAVESGEAVSDTPPLIPAKPPRKCTILDSFTQEALQPVQIANPKGVICFKDEISGFIGSMGRYSGSGQAEKAYYLSGYDGKRASDHKVKYGDEPLIIPKTGLSLIGGVQPEKLHLINGGDDDGFAARFLMVAPAIRKVDQIPDPSLKPDSEFLYQVFLRLSKFEHDPCSTYDNPIAITLPLDKEAKTLFGDWYIGHKAKSDQLDGAKASYWGKMQGQALRLALILECLDGACNSVTNNSFEPVRVSYASMKAALELIEYYFKPTVKNVLGGLGDAPNIRATRDLAKKIIEDRPEKINSTEIRRKWKIEGLRTAAPIMEATQGLIDLNWIYWTEQPRNGGNGRRKNEWTVNPLVYSSFNSASTRSSGATSANTGFSDRSTTSQQVSSGLKGSKDPSQQNPLDPTCPVVDQPQSNENTPVDPLDPLDRQEPDENGIIWEDV